MADYKLLMEFIDESPNFVHGFECGLIWAALSAGNQLEKFAIHLENSAQIQMICDYFNLKCSIKTLDDTWASLTVLNKL